MDKARSIPKLQEQISDIVENLNMGFIAFDKELNFVYVNKATEQFFSRAISREDLIGKNILQISPNFKQTSFYTYYKEALRKQKKVVFEDWNEPLKKWIEISV